MMKKILLVFLSFYLIFFGSFFYTLGYEIKPKVKERMDIKLENFYIKIGEKDLDVQIKVYKKLKIKLNILKDKYKTGIKAELVSYVYDEVKKKYSEVFKKYLIRMNKTKKEVRFDSCGKIDKYKNEDWYLKFVEILSKNNISQEIIDSCLSLDKNIFIFMLKGNYCGGPIIYKYKIETGIIGKAKIDDNDRGCLVSTLEFGKRNGYSISLQGRGGDAGCSSKMYYSYNYLDNIVVLKKECTKCEGEKKYKCENY